MLFVLLLNPYRCTQCLRRFFQFRSRWARRAVTVTLCLIPLVILVVWFLGLSSLQRVRALSAPERPAPEQPKPTTLSPKTIEEIISGRRQ